MRPTVAAVILFFNKPELTRRCIESVLKQNPDFLVLVNNGSTHEMQRQIESIVATTKKVFTLTLFNNCGFSKGMNKGIEHAFLLGADWVCALSNDIEVDECFFLKVSELPHAEPVIYCPKVFFLMDRKKVAYTHGVVKIEKQSLRLEHLVEHSQEEVRFPDYYPAAVTVWNRAAFEKLRGFSERFFCYWEDVELSLRAKIKDVRLLLAPHLKIFHLGQGTTKGKALYREEFRKGERALWALLNDDKRLV